MEERSLILYFAGAGVYSSGLERREMTFSELTEMLREPVISQETYREYLAMSKDQQGRTKHVGGFVAGELRGGVRNAESVLSRELITIDVDDWAPDQLDAFPYVLKMMFGYRAVIYSTHKHSPSAPRVRVLFPLDRKVTPEEYPALARKVAEETGLLSGADGVSFRPSQLMFLPSCSSDAKYYFREVPGRPVPVDEVLGRYADWRDVGSWPLAPGEKNAAGHEPGKKMEDPLEKEGIIGAFCRSYSISEAMDEFIPGVYDFAGDCGKFARYTLHGGTTYGGARVYDDDLFLYSEHASDPCSHRECNAFDMVRIHKYGELDADLPDSTPLNDLPSMKAMLALAGKDEAVRRELSGFQVLEPDDDADDWPEPQPLGAGVEPEPFPVDCLPPIYRDMVNATAEQLQVPVDMPAAQALAVMAAALSPGWVCEVKPGWEEDLNLWFVITGDPSEKKSPALKEMIQPVIEQQREIQEEARERMAKAAAEIKLLEESVKSKRKRLANWNNSKQSAEDYETLKESYLQEDVLLSQMKEYRMPQLLIDDTTPEALVDVMSANGGALAMISDEPGIFGKLRQKRNDRETGIEIYLKAYSGGDITQNRVGRGYVTVSNARLTMAVCSQPDVTAEVLNDRDLSGRGFLSRLIYCDISKRTRYGERNVDAEPIPPEVKQAYSYAVKKMYTRAPENADNRQRVKLSADALAEFQAYRQEMETAQGSGNALCDVRNWASKHDGRTARIAALLHLSTSPEPGAEISAETTRNAIQIARWATTGALAAFANTPEVSDARYTLERIKTLQKSGKEPTVRELKRSHKYRRDDKELRSCLQELQGAGYIRVLREQTGGRISEKIEISPKI